MTDDRLESATRSFPATSPRRAITVPFKTVTSKAGRDVTLNLDVFLPAEASRDSPPLACVVFFHGGGFVFGTRNASLPPHIFEAPDKYNLAIVSPDYRLCPQARLPDVQEDASDALSFILDGLNAAIASAHPTAPRLDTSSVVVTGASAGGFIALWVSLGMCAPPSVTSRIRACASLYPATNLGAEWYAHPRRGPTAFPLLSDEQVAALSAFADPDGPLEVAPPPEASARLSLAIAGIQRGIWPSYLLSEEQLRQGWMKKSSVTDHVDNANVDEAKRWPPLFFLHGSEDSLVTVEQSREVVQALIAKGMEVQYEEMEGKDHGYDYAPSEEMAAFWSFVTSPLPGRT